MQTINQIQIAILFVFFVLAALFSAAETALIGMNRIKIISNIKSNHPKSKYLKVWLQDPNKLLATLSICINVVAITASTIGAFLSIQFADAFKIDHTLSAAVMAALITIIIIIFGEISPKIFAIHNTEKIGLLLIAPVVIIYRMISPLTELFVKISSFTIRIFGGQPSSSIPVISAKDITTVINVGAEAGYIDEQEKFMMSRIMGFNDTTVKHVMVPRTAVTAIDLNWSEDRILDVIIESGYSRMPVFRDNLDNIVGVIYTKDMLSMIKNRGLIIFHDLVRPPYFVPDTKNIGELMKEFKKGKLHMAVVLDEFGGTEGIVSLEDILEEIVGEIKDEYDVDEKEIEDCGKGCYIVRGSMELSKLNASPLKLDIPDQDSVYSIGGFVTELFGHVPRQGETIKMANFTFTVIKSDEKKISRLKIETAP